MHQGDGRYRTCRPQDNSVSSVCRFLVPASLASVVLAIFLGIASSGRWPILPFIDLKMPAVCQALRYMGQHASDNLRMTMRDDRAVIEHCERGRVDRFEFSRHRAFLVIGEPRGLERGRLALRSHEK